MNIAQLHKKIERDNANQIEISAQFNSYNNIMAVRYIGENMKKLNNGFYTFRKNDNTNMYIYIMFELSDVNEDYLIVPTCFSKDLYINDNGNIIFYKK